MKSIPKIYDASEVEDKIYKAWEKSSFFNPDQLRGKRSGHFSIAMPPPNATGILHIGHAMFLTIQDLVIRFARMRGKKALWLPGTDHAAIATQAKVERILLEKEGKTKHDIGRDEFLRRVDEYVEQSRDTIRKQIRKMGSSCDWSRERFTLDKGLSLSVREAFVRMYKAGLIYRGERIVNWCPHCESTLADDEVEYRESAAKFYYFRFGPVIIGTARPETKFLDKTIVVHPSDKRYKQLVGKEFDVDWIDGKIKANVIADSVMDMNFGSGAMTITPAHSFADFDLAKKHKLPIVKIIDEKGNFTQAAGKFAGQNARESRDEIVSILKNKDLLEKIDDHYTHNLSVCYRCETPVEPLPKSQWWVDVNKEFLISNSPNSPNFQFPITKKKASLKELALWVVESGQIEIIPKRFEKVYFHWMENLRDWCISRQIWYGHRIPVWYRKGIKNKESGIREGKALQATSHAYRQAGYKLQAQEIYVGVEPPKGDGWEQDPDTLDTWFSSGLWTFSTLGWPKHSKDLKAFHPTSFMETGYDILFFWVARMILLSNFLMGEVPFRQVYLHGLVRDEKGRKMSKSLGNVIDPLDIIPKYGTDAIRLSLVIGTTPGNDLNLGETKIAGYRNFVNKLWNISRYVLMTVEPRIIDKVLEPKTLADKWILSEFHSLVKQATEGLDKYQFSSVGEKIYEFTWSKFADWYLGVAKLQIANSPAAAGQTCLPGRQVRKSETTNHVLNYILQNLLKLWHPFCPFVTEEIWSKISKDLLMIQDWPKIKNAEDSKSIKNFEVIQDMITEIRNVRAEYAIHSKTTLTLSMLPDARYRKVIKENAHVIEHLARVKLGFPEVMKRRRGEGVAEFVFEAGVLFTDLSGIINFQQEIEKLNKEVKNLEDRRKSLRLQLQNKEFLKKAPEHIIKNLEQKFEETKQRYRKKKEYLENLL